MHYNRRQRREIAKSIGLGKNESKEAREERIVRAIEAGRQIDRQFKNQVETNLRYQAAEKDAEILESLTEKYGKEKANKIMTDNAKITAAREENLARRREKRKGAFEDKKKKM